MSDGLSVNVLVQLEGDIRQVDGALYDCHARLGQRGYGKPGT